MPRLHPITGLAACGTAGGRVTYGGRSGEAFPLCDGGCTFWLNADEIAFIGPESGSWSGGGRTLAQRVNIHTRARVALDELRQPSYLAASPAGRWQGALAGQGGTFGSCGEFPGGTISRAMTDGRGAAAPDGTIALLDLYQGGGNGFRLGRPDGSIYPALELPGIGAGEPDPYHLTAIDANRAIWPRAGSWGTFGLAGAPPKWIPGSLRACYVEIAGVAYLVHWLDGRGLVARRADSTIGKILATADREFHYDAIAWNGGIRIAWATIDGEPPGSLEIIEWDLQSDLEELAPAPRPSFTFTHPISVYPYKAAGSGRPDVFTLGTYTEAPTPPNPLPPGRLLLAHDSPADWTIPAGDLRSYDLVLWELYRVKGETLEQSIARWDRQARAYLEQWPCDCGVIPMFYTQGGAPGGNPPPLWTVDEVLEGLEALDAIANLSPRIKVIAPFAYDRANGIRAYPELRQAFDDLVAAAARVGEATLTPVPPANGIAVTITATPLEGPAPLAVRAVATIAHGPASSIAWRWRPRGDPDWRIAVVNQGSDPDHTFRLDDAGAYELQAVVEGPTSRGFSNIETATATNALRAHTKGSRVMEIDGKTIRLRGPAGKLFTPDAPNTGTWGSLGKGWRGAKWIDDEHAAAAQFKAAKLPNGRYTFTHVEHLGVAGADATKYSGAIDQQFYCKPDGDTDAGEYEQWRVYDGNENGALEAQIEHVTDDDLRRPYFSCPLAVEVVS